MLFEYPPLPAGLSTQGELLYRGLYEQGVDVKGVHWESPAEKEWYYRWYQPDVAVGIGYWGYAPDIITHPLAHGVQPLPWLVADGYIATYRNDLNALPLILVTSEWVKEVYARDGINPEIIEVLPVGCDTDVFIPRPSDDPKIMAVRASLGVAADELMLLTIGGDAASKGAQEVLQALAMIKDRLPPWKYICKVWPQPRTKTQNQADLDLVHRLGLDAHVRYVTCNVSRNYMPYLLGACDIYAGPSRLEGYGMPHVEAGASGKPVIAINAMAFRDTMVHGETALLAAVAQENRISEAILDEHAGTLKGKHVIFDPPRIADYRASAPDIAEHLLRLIQDAALRKTMGEHGRARVVTYFDYRVVATRFMEIVSRRLPSLVKSMPEPSYRLASVGPTG
jgi:glycosyltransferase involved in cell wall biosynthesis